MQDFIFTAEQYDRLLDRRTLTAPPAVGEPYRDGEDQSSIYFAQRNANGEVVWSPAAWRMPPEDAERILAERDAARLRESAPDFPEDTLFLEPSEG